jgi:prevent-host-death family protein
VVTIMEPKSATSTNPGEVGIRELRDNLSRHLKTVKEGGELTVTDHGKPVARLVPWDGMSKFDRLVAEGRITPAKRPKMSLPPPLPGEGGVSDLIKEQRG